MGFMCEKCWADAYDPNPSQGRGQVERYQELIAERVGVRRCTPRQQAGQWWDETRQRDMRHTEDEIRAMR